MNILEEFWYGNIEPAEYDTSSGKEYKELLQKQAELSLIYHKGARGIVYDIGNFVLDLMLAVHPELIAKQEDTDAE